MAEMLQVSNGQRTIERCRVGDVRAWHVVFHHYHPVLVEVIRQALRRFPIPECDLEEMASTCLSRFWIALRNGLRIEAGEVADYIAASGRYEAWRWVVRRRQAAQAATGP